MQLTSDSVKKVAQLANLPLDQSEEELYSGQISSILDYVDQLEKVPTENISPLYNTTGLSNILSEDETNTSITQDKALSNAKNITGGLFVAKGVFDHE